MIWETGEDFMSKSWRSKEMETTNCSTENKEEMQVNFHYSVDLLINSIRNKDDDDDDDDDNNNNDNNNKALNNTNIY